MNGRTPLSQQAKGAFEKRLKELRLKHGKNQTETAEGLGVSYPKYRSWETGRTEPNLDDLCHVARYYKTTVDYLLGRENAETSSFGIAWVQQQLPRNAEEESILSIFREMISSGNADYPKDQIERAVKEVLALGMVRIVDTPARDLQLEKRVIQEFRKYGLRNAIIVPYEDDLGSELKTVVIGHAASEYFKEVVKNGDKVGLAGGSSISGLVYSLLQNTEIDRFPAIEIHPIAIHPVDNRVDICANALAGVLAYRYRQRGIRGYALHDSGFYVGEIEQYLRGERTKYSLRLAAGIDKVFIGIGSMELLASLLRNVLIAVGVDIEYLEKSGAVGDLLYHPINIYGEELMEEEIGRRICSIPLEQLRSMVKTGNLVVGVIGREDQQKVKPVYGAIRGGYINVLIAAKYLAERLLALEEELEGRLDNGK